MAADIPTDLLRAVWEYPFFDTLYGRRTRRFGLGFETAQGPYQYRSSKAPVPLCEEEEALLVAAGIGFSGMALWDQSPAAAVPEQRRPNLPGHVARSARRCFLRTIAAFTSSIRARAQPIG